MIEDNGKTFVTFNIHLFGLSLPQAYKIANCLRFHALEASKDPTKYFVSAMGDFNFRCENKPIIQIPEFKASFKHPKLSKISKIIKGGA